MIKTFRGIIQSNEAPQDKESIWLYQDKLYYYSNGEWKVISDFTPQDIQYNNSEYSEISNMGNALDTLLYKTPKVTYFSLKQAGVYERGEIVSNQEFSWGCNKKTITSQKLNGISIPVGINKLTFNKDIADNTKYILTISDGTNSDSASVSILFVDYIYYKSSALNEGIYSKLDYNTKDLTVTAKNNEYIHIFIPNSLGITKIVYNNIDSTDAFNKYNHTFTTDTGVEVKGVLYISKNHSLGKVTLNFE